MSSSLSPYLTIEKFIGETPLEALERLRIEKGFPTSLPLAYAGRLDPMATGTLLILIGDTCKVQEQYHHLDKEYEFEVLLGVQTDTADVLGLITTLGSSLTPSADELVTISTSLCGSICIPYPSFSSRTVQGKPLHTWALEGRLHEIEIPVKKSRIYSLRNIGIYKITFDDLQNEIHTKIESIPTVLDPKKALGKDFRRESIRASWKSFFEAHPHEEFTILKFRCIASSGTYMRSLAEIIGEKLNTSALAYSIHRTKIGTFLPFFGPFGIWTKKF